MELDLKSASKADQSTEYLVFGFIRDYEKNSNAIIPPLISWTCLLFYWINEYFEIVGDNLNASEDKLTISCNQPVSRWCNASFGHRKIKSGLTGVYRWTFKWFGRHIAFCVTDADGTVTDKACAWGENTNYYGIFIATGFKLRRGEGGANYEAYFEGIDNKAGNIQDHTLTVVLDLNSKQVSFEIDGENKGIAFDGIKCGEDIYYRMAVTIEECSDKVILDKHEINHD